MRMIFVNLPVKDVKKSRAFFTALGFSINEMFSTDDCVSVVIEENIVAMCLAESRFKDFIKSGIADNSANKEVLICLSAGSKDEVLDLKAKALANGGSAWMAPQDHGFMYGESFCDPDGHVWEVMWMDMAAAEQGQHLEIETAPA